MANASGVKRVFMVLVVLALLGVGARYAMTAIPAYKATRPAAPPAPRVWVRVAEEAQRPESARFSVHDEFEGARIGWGYEVELSEDVRVVYVAGRTVGFTWKDGFSGEDITAEARYFNTGTTRQSGLATWWECQLRAQ